MLARPGFQIPPQFFPPPPSLSPLWDHGTNSMPQISGAGAYAAAFFQQGCFMFSYKVPLYLYVTCIMVFVSMVMLSSSQNLLCAPAGHMLPTRLLPPSCQVYYFHLSLFQLQTKCIINNMCIETAKTFNNLYARTHTHRTNELINRAILSMFTHKSNGATLR